MDQTPQNLSRQFSLGLTMQAIIHGGPISRASIAKQTGLSKQTISETVRHLVELGLVRETGRTSGHVGRSATTYELVPESSFMVAADLGGTKLRVALVNLAGEVHSETVEPTHPEGGEAVAAQLGRMARALAEAGGVAPCRIRQTVVGCPGVPDQATGRVQFAPNIAGIDRIDFRQKVSDQVGTPVILENDVNLAVLGEQWLGVGQGAENLAFLALGTGIGAGLICNGGLLRGATGAAGELGFLPFGADPFEPESLRVGAFERVVATQGIREAYRALGGGDLTVAQIFDAATAGDAAAQQVLSRTAQHLARAVAAIAAMTAPELVILGGSIGMREEIITATRAEIARCFPFPVRIEPSQLGNHAALAGAVAIGLTELHTALLAQGSARAVFSLPIPKGQIVGKPA